MNEKTIVAKFEYGELVNFKEGIEEGLYKVTRRMAMYDMDKDHSTVAYDLKYCIGYNNRYWVYENRLSKLKQEE